MFEKITDHIYIHPAETYTDRPNIGLVAGEKYSLLFDAGNSVYHVNNLKKELCEQGLREPDYVIVSHWHWDHSFGADAWNKTIIAGEKTNEYLKKVSTWTWDDEAMCKRLESGEDIEFCHYMIKREYPDRSIISVKTADIVFNDTLTLDLGGVTAVLSHIKGPHADDSIVCFVPEDEFLFLGDSNSKDLLNNKWHFDPGHDELLEDEIAKIPYDKTLVAEYIATLEKIPFVRCIGGHMDIMTRQEVYHMVNE